jgi:hypothetical protein
MASTNGMQYRQRILTSTMAFVSNPFFAMVNGNSASVPTDEGCLANVGNRCGESRGGIEKLAGEDVGMH